MLKNKEYSNILLVGSTSEIGLAIIEKISKSKKSTVFFVGRSEPNLPLYLYRNIRTEFIYCDLLNLNTVDKALKKIKRSFKIDLMILAAGYLPNENTEFDSQTVRNTLQVNALSSIIILTEVANEMVKIGVGDILVLSSVAGIRARLKNFTYGSSKSALDFYAIGLANKLRKKCVRVLIIRPGFVYTKMTTNFKAAPFAIDSYEVGRIAASAINSKKTVIYAPRKLKFIMNILRILPRSIFNRFG